MRTKPGIIQTRGDLVLGFFVAVVLGVVVLGVAYLLLPPGFPLKTPKSDMIYPLCTELPEFRVGKTDVVLRHHTKDACVYINEVFFSKVTQDGFRSEEKTTKGKLVDLQAWLIQRTKGMPIAFEVYAGLGQISLNILAVNASSK